MKGIRTFYHNVSQTNRFNLRLNQTLNITLSQLLLVKMKNSRVRKCVVKLRNANIQHLSIMRKVCVGTVTIVEVEISYLQNVNTKIGDFTQEAFVKHAILKSFSIRNQKRS